MTSQALTAFDQPMFLSELHVLARFHPKCTPATHEGRKASQELLLPSAKSMNAHGNIWTYIHCPYSKRLQISLVRCSFHVLYVFPGIHGRAFLVTLVHVVH